MKKNILIAFFVSLCFGAFSQDMLRDRLLEVYSLEQTQFILDNPQQKKFYDNLMSNSFKIEKVTDNKTKTKKFDVLNSIEYKNIDGTLVSITPEQFIESVAKGTFNTLKLTIERNYDTTTIYWLGNTNHVLKIYSHKALNNLNKQ